MTIASYEQMKRYIESFKNCTSYNTPLLTFRVRYYADSIDIMESWGSSDLKSYEILVSKSQANNFTEYTYNKLINEMLIKIKKQQMNKILTDIQKDFQ